MTTVFARYGNAARVALAALACALWGPHAASQSLPAIGTGARLAANCAACHGTNGVTDGIALPSLAGQGKGVLLVALKAFKSGARQGTIMPQIAKGYTDEQLALLAEYFAAQPPVPTAALAPLPHHIASAADAAGAPVSRVAVTGWLPGRNVADGSGAAAPMPQPVLQRVPQPARHAAVALAEQAP